jgi:hypothetical protein
MFRVLDTLAVCLLGDAIEYRFFIPCRHRTILPGVGGVARGTGCAVSNSDSPEIARRRSASRFKIAGCDRETAIHRACIGCSTAGW